MDINEITNRLAITDLDFNVVNLPTIFKIFESIIGNYVVKISLYSMNETQQYAVVEFYDDSTAKSAYDDLDGVEIESTGHIFNLSFVPDDYKPDQLIDECYNSKEYNDSKTIGKNQGINEDMIQLSEELDVNFDIPEEFRTKVEENNENNIKQTKIEKEKPKKDSISEKLKNTKKNKEVDDFQFNIKDERFKELLEEDEYIIDTSNKKSKQQKASKVIIEEKRKHQTN